MGLWSFFKKLLGKQAAPPEPPAPQNVPAEPQPQVVAEPKPVPEPVRPPGEVTTRRAAPSKAVPSKLRVNIGFDFGTNTTKVVYRVAGGSVARVVGFGSKVPGLPPYCYSSAMSCEDGALYWGPEADVRALSGDRVLRSLKTCLTCRAKQTKECLRRESGCVYDETIRAFGHDPNEMTPAVAATSFVAQALAHAKARILRQLDASTAIWTVNMCVPTSTLRDSGVIRAYEIVLHEGNRLSDALLDDTGGQEFSSREIKRRIQECELPDKREKMTFVVSEALAEVTAYVHSAAVEDRKYAVVDIGAGTTDISFFRPIVRPRAPRKVYWFGTKTVPIAGDAVDDALRSECAAQLPETRETNHNALREVIRHSKENWTEGTALRLRMSDGDKTLPWTNGLRAVSRPYSDLRHAYERAWGAAYETEKGTRKWENVRVLVGGGSSGLPKVKREFLRSVYHGIPNWQEEYIHGPGDLDYGDVASSDDFYRLAVAYGLSTRFGELPGEGFLPPMERPRHRRKSRSIIEWPDDPG